MVLRKDFLLLFYLLSRGVAQLGVQGPVFLQEPPPRLRFSNSTGSQVSCSAHGSPPPDVTWLAKDGTTVTAVPGFRQTLGNGTLYFPPFRAEDYREEVHSTVYRCRAANIGGAILSRDVRVRAVVRQEYEVQVYRAHVLLGNTAVLRCVIPSYVRDDVTVTSWFRDDTIILPGREEAGGRYVVTSSGDLHIRQATSGDASARYSCLTLHALTGERRRSAPGMLSVTEATGSMPPRLTQRSVTTLTVEQGLDVTLSCAAQANPPPTFTWLRESGGSLRSVVATPRVHPAHDALTIRRVRVEDAGRWLCRVNNPFGEQRLETSLVVTAPLSVHVTPQLQVVNSGESATLNCSVSGAPLEGVDWLRNAEPLRASGRVRLLAPLVLHVGAVTRADRGVYQCVARSDKDSAQGGAELRLGDTVPELQSTFIEQALSPGPPVSLRCSATGSPPPQFTWFLDGQALSATALGHRYTIGQYVDQAGDVISHVNISSVRVQDGGLYSCGATNSMGTVHYEARLNIYGPPYVRSLAPLQAVAGADVSLRCPYAGHPVTSISWERRGGPLSTDLRHQTGGDGLLRILHVESSLDTGSYMCTVRGAGGEMARGELLLTVNSPPVVEPFFFPTNLQEGARAQVSCTVSSGDLPIRFSWLKDGSSIPSQLQVIEKEGTEFFSMLIFNKVTSHHSGSYTCVASNNAASANHTSQLVVKVAPQWLREPQDVSMLTGNPVTIHCQAQGFPQPIISWLHGKDHKAADFVPLDQSGSHMYVTTNGSLSISSLTPSDEGFYLCRADNGIGAGLSKVIEISVNEPVRFEVGEKNVTARRGDQISLLCDVRGDHPIQADWLFNGQRVHHSYRSSVSEVKTDGGLQSQLTISQSDRQDSGLYICQAGNVFGHSELLVHLAVQEPPDPPLDLEIIEVGSRSVRMSWHPPFDGHSALIGYLIQYKRATSRIDDWQHSGTVNISVAALEADYTSKNMESLRSAVINDLHPATTYHIRMLAINEIEASIFTDPLTVKTQEEAPIGSPQDVNVQTIGPDELLVSWKPPLPDLWNGEILGYMIHWNVHGVSLTENNTNMHSIRGLTSNELRIKQLRKFTRYDVSVRAFNSVGSGPKSAPVTVTTQEGVPEAAPQNVTCASLSSQSMKVNWLPPPVAQHGGVLQGYKVVYRPVLSDSTIHVVGSEVKRTSSLETYLHGLMKFTNYSVRLLAYTSIGDGVLSDSVFCTTEQDVPGPPAAIKALSLTSDSILVSWLPPEHPNGLITQFTVYVSEGGRLPQPSNYHVRSSANSDTSHEVRGLTELQRYEFWVTASTIVGEGESTRPIVQTPNSRAPARISSFSQTLRQALKTNVILRCIPVGNPTPTIKWLYNKEPVRTDSDSTFSVQLGSLHIGRLEKENEGNYTCSAKNLFGEDQITYQILVLTAPDSPHLDLLHSNQHSLDLRWSIPQDGGTPLLGYILSYKRDHGNWQEVQIDADKISQSLQGLHCGATYHAYITAHNRVGNSRPSAIITANTKGSEPQVPSSSTLISTNSTSLSLLLPSWPDGGCPMLYFVVEYRPMGNGDEWILVDNNAPAKQLLIGDLQSATWYQLRLTAHNSAGSTRVHFSIATTTITGATIAPMKDSHSLSTSAHFYEDVYVIVPAVCSAILLLSAALLVYVAIHRRTCQQGVQYKRGQGMPESPSICKAAAEMDNKRNFQQIYSSSPTKADDHSNSKQQDTSSELYEMSPYATFAVPPDPPRPMNAATLDYSIQFKTFGHSENDSSAHHERPHRLNKKHRHSTSDGDSGRQSAISSSLHRHSNLKQQQQQHHSQKAENGHNSESDTSGSPSAISSYRVPIKQAAARSLEIYRLDSSTESNETSPLPQRRRTPRHYPMCSGERGMQPHASPESSSAEDDASFSSYHLQPPSGFSDSRELSEAECDRDASQLDKLLARFHQQKEQERMQYTIHV